MNKFLKYLVWHILTFNLAGTQVSLKKKQKHMIVQEKTITLYSCLIMPAE